MLQYDDAYLHTFAVCAYKDSPYLSECLDSLMAQEDIDSKIFIATSTPSPMIEETASRYHVPLYVNKGEHGIGEDWNFAYQQANTRYITIAHQDDVYCPQYAKSVVSTLETHPSSLIAFTDYGELRNGVRVQKNRILRIKRFLLRPLYNQQKANLPRRKRAALRFGSAICCPSVTFNAANCPNPPFQTGLKSNLDWATWEHLSRCDGAFLYCRKLLMYHRIHQESTTTKLIATRARDEEDLEMLSRFWPLPIARLIERVYSKGTNSNAL